MTRADLPPSLLRSVESLPPDMRRAALAAIEAGYPTADDEAARQARQEREQRRAHAARLRGLALDVVAALDAGKRPLVVQLEEVVHQVGAGVAALAAWGTAAASYRKLTPVEAHAVQQALASHLVERQLERAGKLLRADPSDRPTLLIEWRETDSLEVPE